MKNTIITIVTLLILLIIIVVGFEKFFNKNIIEPQPQNEMAEILPILEVKEAYDGKTYTFVGSIDLPTPCHSFKSEIIQLSEKEYEIQIATIDPGADIMCAQVISPKSYKVTFDAPSDITVFARINDQRYELSRFVIPEGENIDSFELYIKG